MGLGNRLGNRIFYPVHSWVVSTGVVDAGGWVFAGRPHINPRFDEQTPFEPYLDN